MKKVYTKDTIPRKVIYALALILIFGGIVIFYKYNPSNTSFFPKCPFYLLTGYKCPGCGTQRALHHLLHLRISSALRYNALFVLSIPLVFFLLIAESVKKKYPKIYLISRSPKLSRSILFCICVWWIGRNLFNL